MKDAAELLNNPLVKKTAGVAATAVAATAGVPIPPGVAEKVIEAGANTAGSSSSENKAEKTNTNPAPDGGSNNGSEKKDLGQSKGFEQTTMDIVEHYGQKIIDATGADKLITGAAGALTGFIQSKMTPAPGTAITTGVSSAAAGPLQAIQDTMKSLNPELGDKLKEGIDAVVKTIGR